jgi:glutamine amidotransferase-like uncharacterized protein
MIYPRISRIATNLWQVVALLMVLQATRAQGAETSATVRVALLADLGCTDGKSREAVYKVLSNAPGISIEKVSTSTIADSAFPSKFDVLILPGGTGGGQATAMGVDGGHRITDFVKNGKGVIAICAGGYYVGEGWGPATSSVEIINTKNHDGEHWARGEQFIAVKTTDTETSQTMWYENGPIFKPAEIAGLGNYASLVKYVSDLAAKGAPTGQMEGRDAVIAAPFGKGRVVAFGPHPELSPNVNHWLINSVKWAAAGDDGTSPTVGAVLEGK